MIYPLLKGSKRGVKQPGYHPKGTSIFPMIHPLNERRDNFRSHRISDQCSQGARKNRSFFTWVWNQKHPWNESWEKTHLRFFSKMEKLPRGLQDAGVVYKPISVEQKSEEMSPKMRCDQRQRVMPGSNPQYQKLGDLVGTFGIFSRNTLQETITLN